jgi:hypothetical protein
MGLTMRFALRGMLLLLAMSIPANAAIAGDDILTPVGPELCVPAATDYTFMWWAHGSPIVSSDQPKLLCFRTGKYGMTMDVEKLKMLRLGAIATVQPADAVVSEPTRILEGLPEPDLAMSVKVGGRTYHAVKGAWKQNDWGEYPYRIIDSGHIFQRADILKLEFVDDQHEKLRALGRLEISAWPERLALRLDVTAEADLADGRPEITLDLNGQHFAGSASTDGGLWKAGEQRSAWDSFLPGSSNVPAADDTGSSIVTAESPKLGKVDVHYDPALGACIVAVPSEQWSVAKDLDHLERLKLTLSNPSAHATDLRLFFNHEEIGEGITGLCPMLRDSAGNPSGIPVQISKNWHRDPKARHLLDGPWFHGFSLVHLPARSTTQLEYDITYARWGGVPSASHAQLCLIGWGSNQLWEQSAIGSFGESICYDPDVGLGRSRIDDVRPLMVRSMAKGQPEWTWTTNVGGGDFLVYFDRNNAAKRLINVKTHHRAYGPNLTNVTYAGITEDGCLAAKVEVSLPRCDDINRSFYKLHYEVRRPTAFKRLAFFQLGADRYLGVSFGEVSLGNAQGLVQTFTPEVSKPNYEQTGLKVLGSVPWISLHKTVGDTTSPGASANRGLIIRSWRARLAGKDAPVFAALKGFPADNGRPSAVLELTPPPGVDELQPGDFVDAEIEMVVLPLSAEDYYGPNMNLSAALKTTGNTWKPVDREAKGNTLEVAAVHGTVVHAYPMVVRVDAEQTAEFQVTGGIGYVPITFTGLRDYKGYELLEEVKGTLTRVTQNVHGNDYWQVVYDPVAATWEMIFNVSLDSPADAAQTRRFVFKRGKL